MKSTFRLFFVALWVTVFPAHAQFDAIAISVDYEIACAITPAHMLNCWGSNPRGELGTGVYADQFAPVAVVDMAGGVKSVTTSLYFTCAVTMAGAVKCWGRNQDGLGDARNVESPSPVDVVKLTSGVESIAAGYRHLCAVTTAGGVTCWGFNDSGQLGDGTRNGAYIPTGWFAVGLATGVKQVGGGTEHTCALTVAGGVKCWGSNFLGQLGDGSHTSSLVPVGVAGLSSGVKAISVKGNNACALMEAGTVKCWGSNSYGEAVPIRTGISVPTDVPGISSATAVSVGGAMSCAALAQGGVKCWGSNLLGQMGDGGPVDTVRSPANVAGITGRVSAIGSGLGTTCAMVEDVGLRCWGANYNGEIGDGTKVQRATPVATGRTSFAKSYQGLWWGSPAGVESGWGVNISQQGDVLFATWFTYDAQNRPMWLVMPNGARQSKGAYSGKLYRTTGPAFDTLPWNPSQVGVTEVGTALFNFHKIDEASFQYTVDGTTQLKPITRQYFASPVEFCELGASVRGRDSYEDLWWASPAGAESGWGLNIAHQQDTLFVTWFTYEAGGRANWYVMPNMARTAAGVYSGPVYRTTGPNFSEFPWDRQKVVATEVGNARLTFANRGSGSFTYTIAGKEQTKPIVRQVFSGPTTTCF